jgi:hypothetical protein
MSESRLRLRRARRQDVQAIVRLLASDPLGATRETGGGDELPEAYWQAFDAIAADPRQLLVVAELDGRVVGTLQLTLIPSLTYRGGERGDRSRLSGSTRTAEVTVLAASWWDGRSSRRAHAAAAWSSLRPTSGDQRRCASTSRSAFAPPTRG